LPLIRAPSLQSRAPLPRHVPVLLRRLLESGDCVSRLVSFVSLGASSFLTSPPRPHVPLGAPGAHLTPRSVLRSNAPFTCGSCWRQKGFSTFLPLLFPYNQSMIFPPRFSFLGSRGEGGIFYVVVRLEFPALLVVRGGRMSYPLQSFFGVRLFRTLVPVIFSPPPSQQTFSPLLWALGDANPDSGRWIEVAPLLTPHEG